MALRTPPSWLQNASHPAENDRLTMQGIIATTGIIGSSSLAVTENSPTGMSVLIASGWGAIVGTTQSNMGVYQFYNDASAIATIATANPSNPRIDRVCITVSDAYYSGLLNEVSINVVTGTAAASPVAPATPANSISLATIAVAAGATSILTANITDTRVNVTTNLPVGDITEVQGSTGITVTSGTGPIPVVAIDSTVATLTGTQNLSNKTLIAPEERNTVSATAATGTINFDLLTQGVLYYTTNASANFTLNFRGSGAATLSSILAVGDSISAVFLNTNGGTAYYANAFQIDGSAVTPKWSGGTAPSAGNASSIDAYTFTIIKTAATPTYTVLAGGAVKFA
jgi:hypothetical protein